MMVSVIIPTFNRSDLLREALASVVSQEGVELEAMVVDDGSKEDIRSVCAEFGDTVRYLHQVNQGACAARNHGFREARGEFVKFLDSDDFLEPGCLAAQAARLRESGAEVCYGSWEETGVAEKNPELPPFEAPVADPVDALLGDWWTPNFSYMIRRDFAANAAWDPTLTSAQDFDYALTLALAGARFVYVPARIGYYRFHGQARTSRRKISEWARNREYVLTKGWKVLEKNNALTPQRRHALATSLFHLAQVVFSFDREWYRKIIQSVRELEPGFSPPKRAHAMAVRFLGFEGAEQLLEWRRRLRKGPATS